MFFIYSKSLASVDKLHDTYINLFGKYSEVSAKNLSISLPQPFLAGSNITMEFLYFSQTFSKILSISDDTFSLTLASSFVLS